MNPYDGLNLAQLMELLREPTEPEPISWIPQTAGWIVIIFWMLGALSILSIHIYKTWKRNAYRREALSILKTIEKRSSIEPERVTLEIAALLKRTALAAYPRKQVANLHGPAWAQFLCQTSDNDPLVQDNATLLSTAAYRKRIDSRNLIPPAKRWIERHHV